MVVTDYEIIQKFDHKNSTAIAELLGIEIVELVWEYPASPFLDK
jgi:hypothetical protein